MLVAEKSTRRPARKPTHRRFPRSSAAFALVFPLAVGLAACLTPQAAEASPNFLLIMADDLGYECIRANGGTDYETPHLDALGASGIRFTRCHSQPLCTPSRVQLMTGLYNSRNYIRFGQLDPKARTFGHYFKERGYATVVAGKWQLDGGSRAPEHFGFDRWCLWQITARPSRHWGPGLEIDGEPRTFAEDVFGPDVVVAYLGRFFEEQVATPDRPFFAYCPMILPHDPFLSTPLNLQQTQSKKRSDRELFPGFVHYTDTLVGRLVAKLEALDLRDNTLILFVGDNGTHRTITSIFEGKPYPGGKGKLTRNGTHVPCIVSWPNKVKPGAVSDTLIDFTDVFPTLAEAAGYPLPEAYLTDGLSFLPALTGAGAGPRQWSYCYYERNGDRAKARQFVHNHRFKLYDDGHFYDLHRDPWEKHAIQRPASLVYENLRRALERQMKTARAATPRILSRQAELAKPTYNREPKFDNAGADGV